MRLTSARIQNTALTLTRLAEIFENVTRLDRYLFVELLGPLGFFALVFTGILWLMQSLRLIDTIVSSSASGLVFLEFSSLVLPSVMIFVVPLATFAAALFTLNRMYVESELVVMLMSGQSPWSLLRPLLLFSAATMIAMYAVTLYLMPVSATQLNDRKKEIRSQFANSIIVERRFNHPAPGVTVFISDTNTAGEMSGIFLHDERDRRSPITYSADRAVLVNDEGAILLVMFEGTAQEYNLTTDAVRTVGFDRFAYDLTQFVADDDYRKRSPREYFVHEALNPTEKMLSEYPLGRFLAEAHEKLSLPLLVLTMPILALGGVLAGSFRRGGFALRMTVSVGLMIAMQLLTIVAKGAIGTDASRWPLAYAPVLLSLGIGTGLIYWSTRQKSRPGTRGQ